MKQTLRTFRIASLVITMLVFPFLVTYFLDQWLKPEMNSIDDEGVYFGFLIIGIGLEILIFHIAYYVIIFIKWINRKL